MKNESFFKRRWVKISLGIVLVLVVFRLLLPFILLKAVNKKMAELPGYHGHIEDIRLSILSGAYGVDGLVFSKKDSITQDTTPFLKAASVDASIEWKSLFKGSLVGEIDLVSPELRFTRAKVEPQTIVRDSSFFMKLADMAMPLAVNRFTVQNGKLRYIDEKLGVDVEMNDIQVRATNLRNGYDSTNAYPAAVHATAGVYEGQLEVDVEANPLKMDPTFRMNAQLENVNMPLLNDFFNAYASIDVNAGSFGLYTEAEASGGQFDGYVKPLIRDLDVYSPEDKKDNFFRQAWEALVGFVSEIFENQPKDQIATKIRLQGSLENPNSNWLLAIGYILRNAFIQALQPELDHEINLKGVHPESKS